MDAAIVDALTDAMMRRGVSRSDIESGAGIGHNRLGMVLRKQVPITVDATGRGCGSAPVGISRGR